MTHLARFAPQGMTICPGAVSERHGDWRHCNHNPETNHELKISHRYIRPQCRCFLLFEGRVTFRSWFIFRPFFKKIQFDQTNGADSESKDSDLRSPDGRAQWSAIDRCER